MSVTMLYTATVSASTVDQLIEALHRAADELADKQRDTHGPATVSVEMIPAPATAPAVFQPVSAATDAPVQAASGPSGATLIAQAPRRQTVRPDGPPKVEDLKAAVEAFKATIARIGLEPDLEDLPMAKDKQWLATVLTHGVKGHSPAFRAKLDATLKAASDAIERLSQGSMPSKLRSQLDQAVPADSDVLDAVKLDEWALEALRTARVVLASESSLSQRARIARALEQLVRRQQPADDAMLLKLAARLADNTVVNDLPSAPRPAKVAPADVVDPQAIAALTERRKRFLDRLEEAGFSLGGFGVTDAAHHALLEAEVAAENFGEVSTLVTEMSAKLNSVMNRVDKLNRATSKFARRNAERVLAGMKGIKEEELDLLASPLPYVASAEAIAAKEAELAAAVAIRDAFDQANGPAKAATPAGWTKEAGDESDGSGDGTVPAGSPVEPATAEVIVTEADVTAEADTDAPEADVEVSTGELVSAA